MIYLFLALGSIGLGIVLSFVLVFTCQYLGVDIFENLWLLALPLFIAVIMNIIVIEIYNRYKRK